MHNRTSVGNGEHRAELRRFQAVFDNILDAILLVEETGHVLDLNPAACVLLGLGREEILGRAMFQLLSGRDNEADLGMFRGVIAAGGTSGEYSFARRDGSTVEVEYHIKPNIVPGVELLVLRDVTARKKAEEEVRRERDLVRGILEALPNAITISDLQGKITDCNAAAWKLAGCRSREELVGRNAFEFVAEGDRVRAAENAAKTLQEGSIQSMEYTLLTMDGREYPAELSSGLLRDRSGAPLGFVGVLRGITERVRAESERLKLERRVMQAQKVESLGALAGGVAHDLNNLLVAILGNADLALMELPSYSLARQSLEEIRKAAQRAADLGGQMLAYSGQGRFIIGPVNLSDLIREMEGVLKASVSKKALLEYELAPALPAVTADVTQLRQVVMNLVTNASESLEEGEGKVTIRTQAVEVGREQLVEAYLGEDLPEGKYVSLEVSDTGWGMDEATKARLFEPFFSTKSVGRGLGLAAVLGIVRGHRGAIEVDSAPGEGTTFTVLFPVGAQLPSDQQAPHEAEGGVLGRGSGTILVADAEEAVRRVTKAMLERFGFSVLLAANDEQALQLAEQHAGELAAMLWGVKVPEPEGGEVLRHLRRLCPNLPIILASGYSEEEMLPRFAGQNLAGFIQKPYKPDTLVGKVREVTSKDDRSTF